ncbi:hypothetical protein QJS66_01905 [Kocuria rhizophila]|nr:hypothetical protein QJS66_01905 [Kocuria rhizophila]
MQVVLVIVAAAGRGRGPWDLHAVCSCASSWRTPDLRPLRTTLTTRGTSRSTVRDPQVAGHATCGCCCPGRTPTPLFALLGVLDWPWWPSAHSAAVP